MCYISAREKLVSLPLVGLSQGIGKLVFGVDSNGAEAAERRLVARRNNALFSGRRFLVLASLALVIVAISVGIAFHGAWLAPSFAALDLLVVVFAFRNVERHAGD